MMLHIAVHKFVMYLFSHYFTLCAFWLIWFINQRALYNHALSVIVGVGVVVIGIGVICAHLPLAQG